jgi:hypothetical protein
MGFRLLSATCSFAEELVGQFFLFDLKMRRDVAENAGKEFQP